MTRKYTKGAILLGVILSMGLTSCGILNTNKYESPEVDTQSLFRGEDPTDTTTIANIPWRGVNHRLNMISRLPLF